MKVRSCDSGKDIFSSLSFHKSPFNATTPETRVYENQGPDENKTCLVKLCRVLAHECQFQGKQNKSKSAYMNQDFLLC